jgi:hypothetical protein
MVVDDLHIEGVIVRPSKDDASLARVKTHKGLPLRVGFQPNSRQSVRPSDTLDSHCRGFSHTTSWLLPDATDFTYCTLPGLRSMKIVSAILRAIASYMTHVGRGPWKSQSNQLSDSAATLSDDLKATEQLQAEICEQPMHKRLLA